MLPGTDISQAGTSWRDAPGDIAWAAVVLAEVRSDGSRLISPAAAGDWQWLADHGKARIACLIGHPGSSSREAAQFFAAAVTDLGLGDGDGIAVSLDEADGRNPAQVSVWARMTARSLESVLGRVPVICTSAGFAAAGNCAGLGPYPLWIFAPGSPPGHVPVPEPWESWAVHQGAGGQCFARFTSADRMRTALGATRAKPRQRVSPAARGFLAALNEGSPDLEARMRALGGEIAAELAAQGDA